MKSPIVVAAAVFALACMSLPVRAEDPKRAAEERAEREKHRAEEAQERAEEARERTQEQEKARRERERERRDEERERILERSKDLAEKIRHKVDTKGWLHNPDERAYRRGLEYLDDRRWEKAIDAFDEVLSPPAPSAPPKPPSGVDRKKQPPGAPGWKGPKELLGADAPPRRLDAALYWKAYALHKMGRRSDAQAAIDVLRRDHPKSGWLMQAKILEAEVKQASGHAPSPESETDDDLKLIALNALAKTDPERAVPLLEKILISPAAPGLQERALFVLAQSGSPRAREITVRIVRGSSNPDLQMKAVRNLAAIGDEQSQDALADAYRQSTDVELKKLILHHLTAMGAHEHVVALVQAETDPELLTAAARSLIGGGRKGLHVEGGKAVPGVSDDRLASLYSDKADAGVRREIVDVLADRGSARALVAVARKEKEPELRRHIVERLSSMKSQEATDYLVEILGQ